MDTRNGIRSSVIAPGGFSGTEITSKIPFDRWGEELVITLYRRSVGDRPGGTFPAPGDASLVSGAVLMAGTGWSAY